MPDISKKYVLVKSGKDTPVNHTIRILVPINSPKIENPQKFDLKSQSILRDSFWNWVKPATDTIGQRLVQDPHWKPPSSYNCQIENFAIQSPSPLPSFSCSEHLQYLLCPFCSGVGSPAFPDRTIHKTEKGSKYDRTTKKGEIFATENMFNWDPTTEKMTNF